MNRRSFFTKLGLTAATLAILPTATTYARKWVAPMAESQLWIPNPEWVNAPYEMAFLLDRHNFKYLNAEIVRFTKERDQLVQVPRYIKA